LFTSLTLFIFLYPGSATLKVIKAMSKINAKENKAITADSLRIEPLLNGFLMLMLEIISSLN
tara:strand:+ start:367 stop:552 length:186 start_codon:yes stop_codon:yes gene_type:complete